MIAEEYYQHNNPNISIPKGKTVSFIIQTIQEVPQYFVLALKNPEIKLPLNENKLTQILVEQINSLLLEKGVSILAQNQYSDLFYATKGIPDFYFKEIEKGKTDKPLYIVESKILPSPPPKDREKEYVIGEKQNGGIERFKIHKHGKGLNDCGIVGFVIENDFEYWKNKINNWIYELSKIDDFWSENEEVKLINKTNDFAFIHSIAHRKKDNDISLSHFWIKV